MNNKALIAIAASICMTAAPSAYAGKGFNYTYGELGYRNLDSDVAEGDGFRAAFSFGATDYVNVIGEYSRVWVDEVEDTDDADLDLDEFKIGLGGHYPVHDIVDLGGTVAYVDQEYTGKVRVEAGDPKTNLNVSEEGYEIAAYARIQAAKKFEITPHVNHMDVGDFSETGFGADFLYNFHKKFSAKLGATYFSDDSTLDLFLGVRLDM